MDRKYFGTDGIRGTANTHPMTPEIAMRLGMAAGKYFRTTSQRRHSVVIGKDTRLSGYMIEPALVAGFTAVGMDVTLFGPLPTPGVAMMTRSLRADLGVMISASHNGYEDNGIKLFGPNGYKLSDEIELEIESRMDRALDDKLAASRDLGRTVRIDDAQARYVEIVKASFPRGMNLKGLRVCIDCANGAAYKVAPSALYELGAEVFKIGVNPDGFNINQEVGSTDTGALKEAVQTYRADIGIALDGDADRCVIVDELGQIVGCDHLTAVLAQRFLRDNPGSAIVYDLRSTKAVEEDILAAGGKPVRGRVGHVFMKAALAEHRGAFGGELSGHFYFRDNFVCDSGVLAMVTALNLVGRKENEGRPLSQLVEDKLGVTMTEIIDEQK